MIIDIVKVLFPLVTSFIIGIGITPIVSDFLYRNKLWKKRNVRAAVDGSPATISQKLHDDEGKKTPRMGGVVMWVSVAATALIIWIISHVIDGDLAIKLDFISRNQTWIPLATLVFGSLFGLIDDYLETKETGGDHIAGGLSLAKRLFAVSAIALAVALWFYIKLEVNSIGLPVAEDLMIGWLFIPLFVVVAIGIYSGGVIDGLDGLSGGIFAAIFASYAGIAFYQNQIDLAAFCAAVVGGILAFLWFNIPPARFYLSETGIMGLTITLTVVAFMTDTLGGGYGFIVLPIIALPLIIESGSSLIQVLSKKYLGRKVFLVAPIHHHFQAKGWPAAKVVMRFWIIGVVCALLGLILALVGQ
ncbi:MAG: hypothetical protein COV34_02190 [Candidatus Zambryskibacteria bacterium CG10_big_fil_rev_8_21_14_0_10_42_12]|uniref:Phospho-N-acetylmuramoyl-pentapeptide-transferase n=1 Tax=Candidatus Zambryskibacteria bacterium CG10_big_fil_rev_8_21_14_0_10_42_12 TaxID=1975115 RepID=A0A2H0QX49_9BACT|nr:MAG: hypothetical protein COV34_02190 [Candidatus Zambryskibacteria bacterium CG10_big_fil_rev_8_21_14_0_10_42_12]